jgi:threonine dehydrogenase-like Zn-dependent dehydrogenase
MKPLLELIEQGRVDPTFVITHHLPLESAPEGYRMFRDKEDECIKIVLKPGMKKEDIRRPTDGGTLH